VKDHKQLGYLIRQMVKTFHLQHHKSKEEIMAHLAQHLGVRPKTLYAWQEGRNIPRAETLAELVRLGATQAGMDRKWAYKVLYWGKYTHWQDLIATLYPQPPDTLRHNLSHRSYVALVGRTAELNRIEDWLARSYAPGPLVIEGLGGSGKSALALEVAWRYLAQATRRAPSLSSEVVIWFSAQPALLTAQGIGRTPSNNTHLEDVYRTIAEVLGVPVNRDAPPTTLYREIMPALRQVDRVLLFLDGVERLDTPALLAFLAALPANTYALLTSRCHLNLPRPLRLRPLATPVAVELTTLACAQYNLSLTSEEMARLTAGTYGLPLALTWAIGRMALYGDTVEIVLHHVDDPHADLQVFLFEEFITQLQTEDPLTYRVLTTLTTFSLATPVPVADLAARTGITLDAARGGLQHLTNWYVGNFTPDGDFNLHPLVYRFVRATTVTPSAGSPPQRDE